jgi:Icc-related predicted phosphoesterase
MLICYTSDLHGSANRDGQLDALVRQERPDLVLWGGDMLADADPSDPIGTQVAFIHDEIVPLVRGWRDALPQINVGMVVGNHDLLCARDALAELHERGVLVLLEPDRPWTSGGVTFVGYGHSPPTPFWVKDFERLDHAGSPIPTLTFAGGIWDRRKRAVIDRATAEHFRSVPTIEDELARVPRVADPWVFVCHCPPFDTHTDHSVVAVKSLGSRSVRRFIEERAPLCSLHGHIHEAPRMSGHYSDTVGRTLCINAGQERDRLHAVLFEADRPRATLRHTVRG